ncbi:MAG: STAS domain-containing protein [Planctomycetota bacterium]|jgi:anti-anti-sigma regulatory factor
MGIQYLSEQALLVTLPKEPHLGNELEIAIRMTSTHAKRDVIIDFSLVTIMPSGTLSELMILERQLGDFGRQLVLCAVPRSIRQIFNRVGLGGLFRFAADQFAALQSLDLSERSCG